MRNNDFGGGIMNGESTNIFVKIWDWILDRWDDFTDWEFFPALTILVIGIFVIWGCIRFIQYKDEKDYPYGEYEMTYRVYYTEKNVKDYTITHNRPIILSSHEGSNRITKHNDGTVIETNAPIEVVRYIKKK